jgi:hypothetical protein
MSNSNFSKRTSEGQESENNGFHLHAAASSWCSAQRARGLRLSRIAMLCKSLMLSLPWVPTLAMLCNVRGTSGDATNEREAYR